MVNEMELRTPVQEAREDIFFGQAVMVWSRWAIIGTATLLAVWTAHSVAELAVRVTFVIALMGMNFYLHGRQMIDRPANRYLILVAATIDVAVISAMIVTWSPAGFGSQLFVLYYPVLLGVALVFPPRIAIVFGACALALYVLTLGAGLPADWSAVKEALMRLLTLAATVGLGTFHWRVERAKRRQTARS